jgi:aquaporin Z
LGAFVGILVLWLILGSRVNLGANFAQGAIVRSSAAGTHIIALLAEIMLTFVLVLSFLSASCKKESSASTGIIVGLILTATYLLGVFFTGGALNPARSLAPAVVQLGTPIRQLWIFIVGPFIGAIIAGLKHMCNCKKNEEHVQIEEIHD